MRSFITQNEINKSKKIQVSNVMTCRTIHGVYLLTRPCGLCYVSKTKRELRIRISKHESNIGKKIEIKKTKEREKKEVLYSETFSADWMWHFLSTVQGNWSHYVTEKREQ